MKQLLILSGKGGTGKTTIAGAFIRLMQAQAYADCDVEAPNLHLLMQPQSEPKRDDFYDQEKAVIDPRLCIRCGACVNNCRFDAIAIGKQYRVIDYACEGCGVCGIVCPARAIRMEPSVAGELMLYTEDAVFSTAQLRMGRGACGLLISEIKKQLCGAAPMADAALIDGSPGVGCSVITSMSGVDMVLIVAEPTICGQADMERILKAAKIFGTKCAVCINKSDISTLHAKSIEESCSLHQIPFVGRIPFDKMAVKAVNEGRSIVDIDCSSGSAVRGVYERTMKLLYA